MARDRSHVVVLGANAALRIRGGALDIVHGPAAERINLKIDIDNPPPCAILFDGRGEFLSGEALRWCAQRGVVIVMPDGPGRMMTLLQSAAEASDSEMLRDVGPAIIRAQCAADPVFVAREIVRTKIAVDKAALGPRVTPAMPRTIARCKAALMTARSVAEIVMIEAKAAGVYWRSHRDLGLIERKGGNLPRTWLRFAYRGKGPEFLGNKHASHPISAMINYCVVVEAGRLARALAGEGMALQIGFLHSDKHGRNSLVWDCIEPLRAKINANVFKFIASREFARADFPASNVKTHRIARPVIAELLKRCLLPDRDILDAATWLRHLVMARGATHAGEAARRRLYGLCSIKEAQGMTDRYSTSPMPMKGQLTRPGFTAECVVTPSPTGGWLIYEPSPTPPDGGYTLTFADEKILPIRAQCSGGVCRVTDS